MKNEGGRTQNKDQRGKHEEQRTHNCRTKARARTRTRPRARTTAVNTDTNTNTDKKVNEKANKNNHDKKARNTSQNTHENGPGENHEREAESNDKRGWSKSSTPKRGSMEQAINRTQNKAEQNIPKQNTHNK